MMTKHTLLFCILCATTLSGCSRVKEELGLIRRTPDEFAIVKRAPLEIPADLNQVASLPPPQPGAQRPQELNPEQAAQMAILGTSSQSAAAPSSGESVLLQKAGATNINPSIRETVNREAVENAEANRPVAKRIMNWGNKQDPGAAVIVDAPAEYKRIQEKKPGETPSIEE